MEEPTISVKIKDLEEIMRMAKTGERGDRDAEPDGTRRQFIAIYFRVKSLLPEPPSQ